jgi:hypothetical protein
LRALGEVQDTFPSKTFEGIVTLSRYAAGPRSDPLYEFWKREGTRMTQAICDGDVRLLGGNRFLVRHVVRDCPSAGVPGRTVGYLVGESEAAMWQATLETYGARFVRRDLGEAVLFDEVTPQSDPEARPLAVEVDARGQRRSELCRLGGGREARHAMGQQAPQRPGMTFTVQFPEPTDVSCEDPHGAVPYRSRFGDGSRDLGRRRAMDSPRDPESRRRHSLERRASRGERERRRRPLGERPRPHRPSPRRPRGEPHFDWSIAEIEIDGRPSPGHP